MLAVAALAASCDSGSSNSVQVGQSRSTTTSATSTAAGPRRHRVGAEAAVAKYLESQGDQYAGDCADAKLPQDKGKWCSTLVSGDDTSDTKTYALGPVGEKPKKQITVTKHGSAQLTPGLQVGVAQGNVGSPQQLTPEQTRRPTPSSPATCSSTRRRGSATASPICRRELDRRHRLRWHRRHRHRHRGSPVGDDRRSPGDEQYPPTGDIVVDNPTVEVGGEVVFRGSGCAPNEALQVSFDGTADRDDHRRQPGQLRRLAHRPAGHRARARTS